MSQHVVVNYTAAELGAALRRARRQRNLSQDELAERLDINRMTISRLERGEPVSIETAVRAANYCGLAVALVPKFSKVTVEER